MSHHLPGSDAVFGDECRRVAIGGRHAGRGDGLAGLFSLGDGAVQVEQLGKQVFLRVKPIRRENGGVEGGVGVLERVLAGRFQGAV
jgi:hypothetical protein